MCGDWDGESYDAVVVGSGYGGSVAACRLSMAGLKVCLVEKGRRWESHDFPTSSLEMVSAFRFENRNSGFSFGSKQGLFQVCVEGDSLAATACGLGGGSLTNAGVLIATPARAKRNPKWPKEWKTADWDICEASASNMLRAQTLPSNFDNAKIMKKIVEGDGYEQNGGHTPLKLAINFDVEDEGEKTGGSCLACGNCLSGCPYNAKNSTDKNYLASATQAGCTIKTDCEVEYIVKNPDIIQENARKNTRRRWLVFFNDIDHISSDFVILSGGVFGTTSILFKSQLRGLEISEKLGLGLSCNGNNVAYLAASSAPLNSYGLNKKQLSFTPFNQRPGPAISSSYTSSLGFTVQSAVLPRAYPYMLFQGIITYNFPPSYWFFYLFFDKFKQILGLKTNKAMVLNAMGHDNSDGKLTFQIKTNKLSFKPPHDPLLPKKIESFQKITKKLGGTLFMSRYRSTSVHLLGGCIASEDSLNGVCNPNGQVFDPRSSGSTHPGLFVCDGSLIPCSIGINPCLTIATLAEHVSRSLVQEMLSYKMKNEGSSVAKSSNRKVGLTLGEAVLFEETMSGFLGGMPCTARLKMKMKMNVKNSKDFDKMSLCFGKSNPILRGKVGGFVVINSIATDKLYVIDGEVDLCQVDIKTPYTQYMHYRLLLATSSGSRYILEGRKVMNPYLFALYGWRESTTMHVTLKKIIQNPKEENIDLKGELCISMIDLLKSVSSLKGRNRAKFVYLFTKSLFQTYFLQIPRGNHKFLASLETSHHEPYPSSILHEIKTEDGFKISCKEWKVKGEKKLNRVLLINGYATESFWLPTEPNDLIRTLLKQGYETWLLQPRLHPCNSSNDFTIEDIARFDIPAVLSKIIEVNGKLGKVHVVAHCVGGLSIHMAIMGGHVSADQIASLSCTNSSMFFHLTASSSFKMWLPLIPISMLILGKNKTLPLLEPLKTTLRHRLLKSIARKIPRYERCKIDECEIFSGIFGNAFWHQNLSSTMHETLNKKTLPNLPMAGFPHLQKICKAGFIVDTKGKNSYLIHPERMALPTLYLSGGRALLVTAKTSFLGSNYMRLHQPGFRHERVVVEGFGHSDLWIGEESPKKVFPVILEHIGLAENGGVENPKYCREVLSWGDDFYDEGRSGFVDWGFLLVMFWVLVSLLGFLWRTL